MAKGKEDRGSGTTELLLKAVSHEMRRRIMRLFVGRAESLSPREASAKLLEPLSNVSYHFRCLAETGAIEIERTRPVRGSMQHFYVLAPEVIEVAWVASILENTDSQ